MRALVNLRVVTQQHTGVFHAKVRPAIFAFDISLLSCHGIGGFGAFRSDPARRLAAVSLLISLGALLLSEWLVRRQRGAEDEA